MLFSKFRRLKKMHAGDRYTLRKTGVKKRRRLRESAHDQLVPVELKMKPAGTTGTPSVPTHDHDSLQ